MAFFLWEWRSLSSGWGRCDSGLITIDRLRHIYPGLPAIIISGDTAPDRLAEARSAGIQVLSKPVLVDPLKSAISAACHIGT